MKNRSINILSTRPVPGSLIFEAKMKGIQVDVLSFIETVAIDTKGIKGSINACLKQRSAIIFTSMNAADAVIKQLDGKIPDWKIFCMGNTTKKIIENYFGNGIVIAAASNANELADGIIKWNTNQKNKEAFVFFCGDQRRDELPQKLNDADIELKEIIVYKTIETSHALSKNYDGILFFSPSAVHSFFINNTTSNDTIFFAIGETTANSIREHTNHKIIVSKTPAKDELLKQAIELFTDD